MFSLMRPTTRIDFLRRYASLIPHSSLKFLRTNYDLISGIGPADFAYDIKREFLPLRLSVWEMLHHACVLSGVGGYSGSAVVALREIMKNVLSRFDPNDPDAKVPGYYQEIQEDIQEECSNHGEVERVLINRGHTDGQVC